MTRTRRAAWLAYTILSAALLSVTGNLIMQARQDALKAAEVTADKFRQMASIGLLQGIQSLDLSLQGLIDGVAVAEKEGLTGLAEQAVMFDRSATAGTFGWLLVLNKEGNVIKSLDGRPGAYENRRNWPSFQAHLHQDHLGLLIQKPYVTNDTALTLSRRLTQNGSFEGVVIGTVKRSFVYRLLEQATPPGGSAVLMGTDGSLLLRAPDGSDSNLKGPEIATRFKTVPTGIYQTSVSRDGSSRIVSYGPIGDYPLLVRVSVKIGAVLAAWRVQSAISGGTVIALIAVLGGFVYFLMKQLEARTVAEKKALRLADELAVLANTDKLTALPNRRHFDSILQKEWARCRRIGSPVSLLMIDVDHFKRFNDTLGHQAGDEALSAIASIVSNAIHRSGDLAARYGGEEFAIILPQTDLNGAKAVAEWILAALIQEPICFPAGPEKRITVSIGCGCAVPFGDNPGILVSRADEALYRAKDSGRNRLETHPPRLHLVSAGGDTMAG